jgi:hypothetical protein
MPTQYIVYAIDAVLSRDVAEDLFADAVIAQASLFAGLNADEFGGFDSD